MVDFSYWYERLVSAALASCIKFRVPASASLSKGFRQQLCHLANGTPRMWGSLKLPETVVEISLSVKVDFAYLACFTRIY